MPTHYSKTFTMPRHQPGLTLRIRATQPDWRRDVPHRMAVVEVQRGPDWLDLSTIREDDMEVIPTEVTPTGPLYTAKRYEVPESHPMGNNGYAWAVVNSNLETVAWAAGQLTARAITEALTDAGVDL
jgi:hypothetical protein